MTVNRLSNSMNNLGRMQHAYLDGVNANVFHHRINLVTQHLRRHAVNGAHAKCVLCGQRSNGRHAVAAQRCDSLEVSLYAGAAAAV